MHKRYLLRGNCTMDKNIKKNMRKSSNILREMLRIYLEKRVSRAAAELAYFLVLSIFPMLICLNAMLGNMFPSEKNFIDMAEGLVPAGTLSILSDYIGYISSNSNSAMVTAGIMLMATTAAAVFRSIHSIMGEIQGKPRYKGPFSLAVSFIFAIVFLGVMYFGVIVVFAGNWFLTFLSDHFWIGVSDAWTWLRFVMLFLILFVIIGGVYRLTEPKEIDEHFLIGTFLASISLVIISICFSWFVGLSSRYPLVYGSLASMIVLMAWLYLCGNILIMGNVLNYVLRCSKEELKQGNNKDNNV